MHSNVKIRPPIVANPTHGDLESTLHEDDSYMFQIFRLLKQKLKKTNTFSINFNYLPFEKVCPFNQNI